VDPALGRKMVPVFISVSQIHTVGKMSMIMKYKLLSFQQLHYYLFV